MEHQGACRKVQETDRAVCRARLQEGLEHWSGYNNHFSSPVGWLRSSLYLLSLLQKPNCGYIWKYCPSIRALMPGTSEADSQIKEGNFGVRGPPGLIRAVWSPDPRAHPATPAILFFRGYVGDKPRELLVLSPVRIRFTDTSWKNLKEFPTLDPFVPAIG